MILQILILLLGFVVLIKGADIMVDGSASTAKNLKIPNIVIGLTIVAFGTSAPELAVSFKAMLSSSGDIVLGNVIGSNIANVLLVLGISSLFCKLKVQSNTIKKEIPIVIMMSLLLSVLFADKLFNNVDVNYISRSDGIAILIFFSIFIYYLIGIIKNSKNKEEKIEKPKFKIGISILLIIIGLVGIIIGSDLVVNSSIRIAQMLGVNERIISFTIIALGTSLPELVTSITSVRKSEQEILIGNIVGSSIFNIGIVLALPIAIFGGFSAVNFSYLDLVMLVLSSVILFLFVKDDRELGKVEGVIMILIFVIYYGYLFFV